MGQKTRRFGGLAAAVVLALGCWAWPQAAYANTALSGTTKANENGAEAVGTGSSAIGDGARAYGTYSFALGKGATVGVKTGVEEPENGYASIAIGGVIGDLPAATVYAKYSVAIGGNSTIYGEGRATAIGVGITIGKEGDAEAGHDTVVIGSYASAADSITTVIGASARGVAEGTIAIGYSAAGGKDSDDTYALAIGYIAAASGVNAVAIGSRTMAEADNSLALGSGSASRAEFSVALGRGVIAYGTSSTVLGKWATTYTDFSFAAGNEAKVGEYGSTGTKGVAGIAIGSKVTKTETVDDTTKTTTIAKAASVLADYGIALGTATSVLAEKSTAIGYGASTTAAATGSVALGQDSVADAANVVSVGKAASGDVAEVTRKIVHVADGTESSDAVAYGQLVNAQATTTTTGEGDGATTKTTYTPYTADASGIIDVKTNDGNTAFQIQLSSGKASVVDYDDTYASPTDGKHWLSTNFGALSVSHGKDSAAYGYSAVASGNYASALGYGAYAGGEYAAALGTAVANGAYAVALGNAVAHTNEAIVAGKGATVGTTDEEGASVMDASGVGGIAIGGQVSDTETGAMVTADYGIALGTSTSVLGEKSVALGYGASTTVEATGSVALGQGSVADAANVISVGAAATSSAAEVTRKIVHVADGSANSDAATYGQLVKNMTYTFDATGKAVIEMNSSTSTAKKTAFTIQLPTGTISSEDGTAKGDGYITGKEIATELKVENKDGSSYTGHYATSDKTTGQSIAALDDQVYQNTTNISTNAGKIAANETAISNLSSKVEGIDGRVTTLETNISSLDGKIDGVTLKQETYAFSPTKTSQNILYKDGGTAFTLQVSGYATSAAIGDTTKLSEKGLGENVTDSILNVNNKLVKNDTYQASAGRVEIKTNGGETAFTIEGLDTSAADLGDVSKLSAAGLGKTVTDSILTVNSNVHKVAAGAAALAALRPEGFNPDDKWSFAVGFGHYKDANAGAIGAFFKPNADTTISFGGTIGYDDSLMNAGVSFKLGSRSKKAAPRTSAEFFQELSALRQNNDKLVAQNASQQKEIEALRADNVRMQKQIEKILEEMAMWESEVEAAEAEAAAEAK